MHRKNRRVRRTTRVEDRDDSFDLPEDPKFVTIKVKVPRQELAHVEDVLTERGSNIDNFFSLKLLAFSRTNVVMGLGDRLNFGKYTGAFVEAVIRADLSYMHWIITKSNCRDRFEPEVRHLIMGLAQEHGLGGLEDTPF